MSMSGTNPQDPERRPWHEGPEEGRSAESWLRLNDDELLQRIETIDSQHDADERLLEVVASDRHFFIRQEAAKRIRRKKLLFPYEDDRHIGQILVRHLNRREDLTYLERLVTRSAHGEVRRAAHVQLARLRKRLAEQERRDATGRARGQGPWKIAVVHTDPGLRQVVADALRAPEFEVVVHESGGATVNAIKTEEPHLLLAGIDDLLGAGLHAAVHNRKQPMAVIVLCDLASSRRLTEVVGRIAEDFILLPSQSGLVAAKVRALLYLTHSAPPRSNRRQASAPIGEEGVLPLLKLCEEEHFTCRLVVTTPDARYFADFADGEMTEAGGVPALGDDEALAAILAARSGTYEIVEGAPFAQEELVDASAASLPQSIVLATPPESHGVAASAPAPARTNPTDVDATLLGWAVHFVVEQVWAHLGTAATAGLLRRTLQEELDQHPLLRVFIVQDNAHVGIDLTLGARLPAEIVGITAEWLVMFLSAGRRIAPDVAKVDVREATRIVGAALEQVGFYVAYERIAAAMKPISLPIGRIIPKRLSD
jgi:DNA-binding NarL/FixJ family response regulator